MTPAEVAKHEGTDEAELLSLLADEKFQEHVAYYRLEAELPEDEREELLVKTALAGLQHLADMGDTKALLFLTYEGNRGRHPENRLRRLASRTTDRRPGLRAGDEIGAEPAEPVAAELVSDLVAFAPSNPDVADWIIRYAESRQATLGESGAKVEEQKRRARQKRD